MTPPDCAATGFSGEGRCIEPAAQVAGGLCAEHARLAETPPGVAAAENEAGSLALVCPYCGATLTINLETEGRPYLTYEVPESIECYATDCGATWEPNGEPRDAPSWVRHPDLFDPPARAVERAVRRVTPPGSSAENDTSETTGHAWVEGRCVNCGADVPRPWGETCLDDFDVWALSLLLRQAARDHLGLSESDYWPSDLADAQARAIIAAGYVIASGSSAPDA